MKHWWKVLGVLLLLSASTAALRIPLAADIVHVSPERIAPGPAVITITGYNTSFNEGAGVYLENDSQQVCATHIDVIRCV